MPRKNDFQLGLETILNNPKTCEKKVLNELHVSSQMGMGQMIKTIGRGARSQKVVKKTDDEKSAERIEGMKVKSEKD
jgi:hypothetical protein